jgi:hypothetical protein
MQFVACRYSATGEGMTVMLLITKGYGPADPETNAQAEFERIFGSYYARGADNMSWFDMTAQYGSFIPTAVSRYVEKDDAGNFSWHTSFHVNFS